jgi:hypothetical protein
MVQVRPYEASSIVGWLGEKLNLLMYIDDYTAIAAINKVLTSPTMPSHKKNPTRCRALFVAMSCNYIGLTL